jgi:hypothetical protein
VISTSLSDSSSSIGAGAEGGTIAGGRGACGLACTGAGGEGAVDGLAGGTTTAGGGTAAGAVDGLAGGTTTAGGAVTAEGAQGADGAGASLAHGIGWSPFASPMSTLPS